MAYGIIDTTFLDLPSNLDQGYYRGFTLRSGLRFTDLASRLDAGLARVNGGVDPLLAMLLAPPTTNVTAMGNRSGAMKAEWKSEYTISRPQYVEPSATMLAIDELQITLGFTEDGLNEISLDAFQLQVDGLAGALEMAARRATLNRLFSAAEVPIATGVSATSPGFAGSGTGGNAFVGSYPDGTPLPGGYTHYYRDTSANRAAVTKTARDQLKKWHRPPFDLIGSDTYIAALKLDAAFVPAGSPLVRVGTGTAEALVDATTYVGVFDSDVRVHMALTDFTDDNAALFKTYGDMNGNNPLVWRYDPLRGQDAYVRSRELFPLANAIAHWKFGPNVSNRVGAGLIRIAASGNYTPPTISF